MKYIKTYENLLKGKSADRILSELEGKSDNDKIFFLIKNNLFDLLPRNKDGVCVYDGYLDFAFEQLFNLPDNFTVNGDFDCKYNNLTSLPENLTVNGDFDCSKNQINSLPKSLIVKGGLSCRTNELTTLPDNLTINGDFDCTNNCLYHLPNNLTVNGNLICADQQSDVILELSQSAKVTGMFYNH